MFNRHSFQFAQHAVTLESGQIARQADGAVRLQMGGTVLLATVVAQREADPARDFLPLTVDYVEKAYAAGRIPAGRLRRETVPTEKEILTCRLIDRAIRPLFPKGFRHEVQIVVQVLSADPEVAPDIPALLACSAALAISGIPLVSLVGAVRVGLINGALLANPVRSLMPYSRLDLVVAGTSTGVLMVESEAQELSESRMLEAVLFGQQQLQAAVDGISCFAESAGRPHWNWVAPPEDPALHDAVDTLARMALEEAYRSATAQIREAALRIVRDRTRELLGRGDAARPTQVDSALSRIERSVVRSRILGGQARLDGRSAHALRALHLRSSVLPRAHGSALFTRGETQALAVVTLGTERDGQMVESLYGRHNERFMLQYNMPPYATGETGRFGTPKRREIGHGRLARRALAAVLPDTAAFPYSIRLVSEVTESNGSSSMASVCAGCLALLDAGVPLRACVAGIAMGLIKDGDHFAILTDILGDEDHLGDMDFKVAGTELGITALQMDIKIDGLTPAIMQEALLRAREARMQVLSAMAELADEMSPELAASAPRLLTLQIPPARIRDVIGKGGATIRALIEQTGASIDVADDGTVNIAAAAQISVDEAKRRIEALTAEVQAGRIYEGVVQKITEFGAFVALRPGQDGLLHVSEIAAKSVERVEDHLAVGQSIRVKVLDTDGRGRIRLSMKALSNDAERPTASNDARC